MRNVLRLGVQSRGRGGRAFRCSLDLRQSKPAIVNVTPSVLGYGPDVAELRE